MTQPANVTGSAAATTPRETIEAIIRAVVDSRTAGDFLKLVEHVAPDFVYKVRGGWALWPFPVAQCGRDAFVELLRNVNVEYENFDSIFHELLIDGDQVAAHRVARTRNRGSGAMLEVDVWDYARFRDGKVVEFAEYPDVSSLPPRE